MKNQSKVRCRTFQLRRRRPRAPPARARRGRGAREAPRRPGAGAARLILLPGGRGRGVGGRGLGDGAQGGAADAPGAYLRARAGLLPLLPTRRVLVGALIFWR